MDIRVQLLESSVAWRNLWEEKERSPQGNKGINSSQENSHSSWRMRFCIAILDFTTLQELKKSWKHITETWVHISTRPQHWAKAEHEENSRWLGGKLEEAELRRTNERTNEHVWAQFQTLCIKQKIHEIKGTSLAPKKGPHSLCLFVCLCCYKMRQAYVLFSRLKRQPPHMQPANIHTWNPIWSDSKQVVRIWEQGEKTKRKKKGERFRWKSPNFSDTGRLSSEEEEEAEGEELRSSQQQQQEKQQQPQQQWRQKGWTKDSVAIFKLCDQISPKI